MISRKQGLPRCDAWGPAAVAAPPPCTALNAPSTNPVTLAIRGHAKPQVSIACDQPGPTTSSPLPLWTVDFGRPLQQANPLALFRVAGVYRCVCAANSRAGWPVEGNCKWRCCRTCSRPRL